MWEQTLAIVLVIGLLISTLWLLRRKGLASGRLGFGERGGVRRQMEVVERLPLTPHHSLHLVRVQDRLILVGVAPGSCAHLESFAPSGAFEEGRN